MAKMMAWKSAPVENRHYRLEKIKLRNSPESLNSFSHQVPGGVYTTFRTYEGNKILPLDYQILRLEGSARLLGQNLHLDEEMLQDLLRQAIAHFTPADTRIRLSVDLQQDLGTVYLALEPLQMLPQVEYARGVWVVTRPLRRLKPEAKQTSFIFVQDEILASLPEGAHEALLLDEAGNILEGLSSNFFAVKDGVMRTAGASVLPGITRSIVLDAVHREEIPLEIQSVTITELPALQEAFLTSSSRSILPIRKIDDALVGNGDPGSVTRRLACAYRQEVCSRLVTL